MEQPSPPRACTGHVPTRGGSATRSTFGCFPTRSSTSSTTPKDKVLFVDPDLVPLVAPHIDKFETVETVVIMGDQASDAIPGSVAYEDLIADQTEHGAWPLLDERLR